jgi:hypothetical protein
MKNIKLILKKIILPTVLAMTLSPSAALAQDNLSSMDYISVIEELTNTKYNGRQSGTEGYDKAAQFLEAQMKSSGIKPIMTEDSYKQEYDVTTAELKSELFKIGDKSYEIMKDYMPFSRASSGKYEFDKIFYVGSGQPEEYSGTTDGVVVFNWYDKNKRFLSGALDRIQTAKSRGARAVFIIADGELKVGNYEHPLSGDDIGIPVVYITEQLAYDVLSVPRSFVQCELPAKNIQLNLEIERKKSKGSNLVGVIQGKREDKAILITTNLDGFGLLPDGRYFQSAKAGATAPAMLLELAKYYRDNKPEYNIIVAMVGSKWTGNEGIKSLIEAINFDNIACTIDLYAMGGSGQPAVFYTSPQYEEFAKKVVPSVLYNNDLGNSLANIISSKTNKLLFLRDSNTWVDDSLTDRADSISSQGLEKGMEYLKTLISNVTAKDKEENNKSFSYNSNDVKTEFDKDANRNITYVESKYFKVYFDDSFKRSITDDYLREIDIIYDRISKFNYYPYIGEKVKLLNLESGSEAAKIAGRDDLINNPERAGGGFASFNRPVIYCRQVALGTVSHELNHLLADYKTKGYENSQIQECQGQSFLVYYSSSRYVENVPELINNYLNSWESPKVIDNAKNYKTAHNWKVFTKNEADPDGWQNSYHTLGSMFSYLKYAYGENAARRATYRIYDSVDNITEDLTEDLNISIDDFLEGWSLWMASSGQSFGQKAESVRRSYKDDLSSYDFGNIYINKDRKEISSNGGSTATPADLDGNVKLNFSQFEQGFNINSFKAEKAGDGIAFTIDYESMKDMNCSLFNPPNGDVIMKVVNNGIKIGKGTVKFSLSTEESKKLLNLQALTMRFGFYEGGSIISFDAGQLKELLNSEENSSVRHVNEGEFTLLKEITKVPPNKEWLISFSEDVDRSSFDDTKIFVLDDKDNLVDCNIEKSLSDKKQVIVKNNKGYENGKAYRLFVMKDVRSNSDKGLGKGVMIRFAIGG